MRPISRRGTVATVGTTALALTLAACSSSTASDSPAEAETEAGTVTVEHAQGATEIPADPQRVVVFDMGTLDTLDALGLGEEVVGVPKASVPSFLGEYESADLADVGTLQEPDHEALARLDPDLVLVGFRSAAAYPELSKAFPTVDVTYEFTEGLAGAERSAALVGEIFGKEAEVEELVAQLDAQVEEIRPAGEAAGTGMVLQTSGGEVTLNGAASRYGPIFTDLGVAEARTGVAAAQHGEVVSFELIRDVNPDWIFAVDRDAAIGQPSGQAAEQVLDNELVAATTAWQTGQVVYLDGERWYVVMHGLNNIQAMLDEIGGALAK
ncbi:siderophore ABC transporter substrate-binding protein [Georgenia sp. AZ-5]|uniref:siderophore ABC transporter substrate-binding protein n=1 Tax=Georgenia sp. AZ-5 TaxID=3367526 RepID=UPI00375478FD